MSQGPLTVPVVVRDRNGADDADEAALVRGTGLNYPSGTDPAFLAQTLRGGRVVADHAMAGNRTTSSPRYDRSVTGGQVIGMIMRRHGVSVSELAGRLGVSDGQIVAWMRGDPALSVVDSVARACATDLATALMELKPDPQDT